MYKKNIVLFSINNYFTIYFSFKFIFLTVLDYPNILFIYSKLIFDYLRKIFSINPFFKKNLSFQVIYEKKKIFVINLLKRGLVFLIFQH